MGISLTRRGFALAAVSVAATVAAFTGASPAQAASSVSVTSPDGGARSTLTVGGGHAELTTCDIKPDGHHSEAQVLGMDALSDGSRSARVKDTDGANSTCHSVILVPISCWTQYVFTAENWEGSTLLSYQRLTTPTMSSC
jgi:hypothetical protein